MYFCSNSYCMILLADSGSSKTHWAFVEGQQVIKEINTLGINPFYQSKQEIETELANALVPQIPSGSRIEQVFFYGAGCLPEKIGVLSEALRKFFYAEIEINTDLLAACRALSGNDPAIVCILGTGSNSCLYDGTAIAHNVSPLGFILGDEGSGAVLGKMLVADVLKNQLPKAMRERFFAQFDLTPAAIMEAVYRKPFPNRFLARLSVFIHQNMHECSELKAIVERSFSAFFERNILQYGYADYPIHFSGSVAYHYKDILNDVAESFNRQLGKVEMYPMSGLIKYHRKLKVKR